MYTCVDSTAVQWLGFLTMLSLPTLVFADAVPLTSGKDKVGTIKIIGDETGERSIVIKNTFGVNVVGVKITFPKGITASCQKCSKTTTGGQVTLNWIGTDLGTDINNPKKGNET